MRRLCARRTGAVAAVVSVLFLAACTTQGASPVGEDAVGNEPSGGADNSGVQAVTVTTDKARYLPNSPVTITVTASNLASFDLQISHLGSPVLTQSVGSAQTYVWTPPSTDYQGYFVAATAKDAQGNPLGTDATAVDVSSDTDKFPRYGFVSSYGTGVDANATATFLNQYHLDIVQFYDWAYRHHLPEPLESSPSPTPSPSWSDIAGRTNYRQTVADLVSSVHAAGMQATSYDLIYGADNGYGSDGSNVSSGWGLFTDKGCQNQDQQGTGVPSWPVTSMFLMDPSNQDWQNYLLGKQSDLIADYNFDGWHADQLGRRTTDDYTCPAAAPVDLAQDMRSMIDAYEVKLPGKELVFNAVSQYGQQQVANSPALGFLYSEVWPGTTPLSTCPNQPQPIPNTQTSYSDLKALIDCNGSLGAGKSTVLAAYVNRAVPQLRTSFNTPDVLLADAVIFAAGGAHIELGDVQHMLSNEYYPNVDLKMEADLQAALPSYYDFLVAYENLLRDGAVANANKITMTDQKTGTVTPSKNDGIAGTVWTFAKSNPNTNTDVLQFLNLNSSADGKWLGGGTTAMPAPTPLGPQTVKYYYQNLASPAAVSFASPDIAQGSPQSLACTSGTDNTGNYLQFTLPGLTYWDMAWVTFGAQPPGVVPCAPVARVAP